MIWKTLTVYLNCFYSDKVLWFYLVSGIGLHWIDFTILFERILLNDYYNLWPSNKKKL